MRRASFCVRTFNTNEESAVLDLPTVRHPLRSLFKTRPKRVSLFSAKEEKKKKNLFGLFSSFPDLSSFFKEDTFIIALLLLLLLLQRERERKREERERETKYENSRASTETTTLKRRFEEKHFVGFLS